VGAATATEGRSAAPRIIPFPYYLKYHPNPEQEARSGLRSGRARSLASRGTPLTHLASTNLLDWVDHTNLLADADGLIECLEDMDPNAPACFYRLRWP